jgi:uncharacterized hydrophobic protein (TIGR00271 family)
LALTRAGTLGAPMIHLRIIAPTYECDNVLDLLKATPSVTNLIYLPQAAQKPEGNVILCDVAREDASVILGDLKELGIPKDGSITIEEITSQISDAADEAEKAAAGAPSDAVVWEEVESRTSENTELSGNFLAFMVISMLIAASGIVLDSTILIIGAMIVGPEFGPLAGLCVAITQRRLDVAKRSLLALAVGFPVGITAAFIFSLIVKETPLGPDSFSLDNHPFTQFISQPDAFSFIVAFFAGMAGVLSLTSTKSGALIGVLVSITTIPAAANIGLAAAYEDWGVCLGALEQLGLNLSAIVLAGVGTLYLQRLLYMRRRRAHLLDHSREAAGLPMGHSRHQPAGASGARESRRR